MYFNDGEAIYLQIANYMSEGILTNKWAEEDKIPSVRDMAIELQVNPNTVMRAYVHLQNKQIIFNKRGLGFFVSNSALEKIHSDKQEYFMSIQLPALFKEMTLLNLTMDDINK